MFPTRMSYICSMTDMQNTPRGLRLHIGIFGRRNVGKSSILNAVTRQHISIVSEIAGTTTDPVEKAMELLPLGPVLFVDTAGIDEVGDLGRMRVEKTMKVLDRVDLAILVTDDIQQYEHDLLALFAERRTPVIVVANKADLRTDDHVEQDARAAGATTVVRVSATDGTGIADLRAALIATAPASFLDTPSILDGIIDAGDLVMLVVPVDSEAPKGRLILPQVQTLRDILDNEAMAMVTKERDLAAALARCATPPALVVTDSQAFGLVSSIVPDEIPLTGFSILFSRFKGDLAASVEGAMAIDRLTPGDRVLIAEGCTHHPSGEDIGRVKLPNWLAERAGGPLDVHVYSGQDFPADLASYKLVVHCGACVLNRRLMLTRIERCHAAGVPLTNYGLAIAYTHGIFERALRPFPSVHEVYTRMRDTR
jgi:[FeFe] hydrogenase H-cluster maturation GTPase HydF